MGQQISSWLFGVEEEKNKKKEKDISTITVHCDIEHLNKDLFSLDINRYSYMNELITQLSAQCQFEIELKDYFVQRQYRTFEFGSEKGENDRICCLGIKNNDILSFVNKNRKSKTINMNQDIKNGALKIEPLANRDGKTIIVKSYHISCKSDEIPCQNTSPTAIVNKFENFEEIEDTKENLKENDKTIISIDYVGIVLYSRNDETDWTINGIHCQSGYIILKETKSFQDKNEKTKGMTVHHQLYYHFFNEFAHYDDVKIVGAGFAIQNGDIKFNSTTFNAPGQRDVNRKDCQYHGKIFSQLDERSCHPLEIKWIMTALYNYKHFKQNTTHIEERTNVCWDCISDIHRIDQL